VLSTPPAFVLSQDQTLRRNLRPSEDGSLASWMVERVLIPSDRLTPAGYPDGFHSVRAVKEFRRDESRLPS
jgi:hypothetical protein